MPTDDPVLQELHREMVKQLLAKIKSGEATAADFTAALNVCKHNGIMSLPEADDNLGELKERLEEVGDNDSLPFPGAASG